MSVPVAIHIDGDSDARQRAIAEFLNQVGGFRAGGA